MSILDTSKIDSVLAKAVEDGSVFGVVGAAADPDGNTYLNAFGKADVERDAPMRSDTLFRIASMTKAVTSVAIMQLIEHGELRLDTPADSVLTELRDAPVLDGFDSQGAPQLRPPKSRPTVHQLLSHTSGFGYEMWSEDLVRYKSATGLPSIFKRGAGFLNAPLLFDPGSRWLYGIGTDWLGRLVERVSGKTLDRYFTDRIFEPLGIRDTHFVVPENRLSRLATVALRTEHGRLMQRPMPVGTSDGFFRGGDGLVSTAGDYLRFLRALLGGGEFAGTRILSPESVQAMARDQLGRLSVEPLRTADPVTSNDVEFFPGTQKRWGLGFLINEEAIPGGRAAGSYGWAGIFNSYYWVDPKSGVCAVILTQVLPFFDPECVALLGRFERALYEG